MENRKNTTNEPNKVIETLTKELEGLNDEELHEFFMFFYKLNHQEFNMIFPEKFDKFLAAFDSNPFKVNEDKTFRKQLIENLIKYTNDHMSLITAAILIKKKFTIDELIQNYYANFDLFNQPWF